MITKQQHDRLDVARGVSAIAVLCDHAYTTFLARLTGPGSDSLLIASILGTHAVAIFFLLSGHLITRSVLSNVQRNGRFVVREYVLARLTRIYPPLLGSVLLCILIALLIRVLDLPGGARPFGAPGDLFQQRTFFTVSLYDVLNALTLQQGGMLEANGPLWTLYIEVQLYVLAGLVAVAWSGDRLSRTCMALLAAIVIALLFSQIAMSSIWLLGAATAFFPRQRRFWAVAGFTALIAVIVLELRHTQVDGYLKEAVLAPTTFAFSVIYGFWLFFTRVRLDSPRLLTATSRFSYSLYIIHFPLLLFGLAVTQNWTGHSASRAIVAASCTFLFIVVAAKCFALVTEDQELYKRLLSRRPDAESG